MDPHSFEKYLGSIFHYDVLLADCEDGDLLKLINDHKYTIIALLSGWKAIHVIHRDGFPRLIMGRKRGMQALLLDGWIRNDTYNAISDNS
jgi:hypothetical protein